MSHSPPSASHPTFPVFLRLEGRPCTVFGGGGTFVEEKVRGLLDAGAVVRLVALELVPELRRDAANGLFTHVRRTFRRGDLHQTFVAIAERDALHLDRIEAEAKRRQVPLNVVDDTPRCSFILASVVRRGDLAVAVSTTGRAPALAVRLRQSLERTLGPQHARFLELAEQLREPLAARIPGFEPRRDVWYRLVDSDVLDLLAAGDESAALAQIAQITGVDLGSFDAEELRETA
ncbi:MAG: bifunctional precorrin-2 dehydrogenase/sirohydrochlorin ferrochelatase [Thermoanaerobaculia bacterium]|nr:bifunctional precorrin-2 dehydrogenase/sirohydrochlorin ferrochelatase [Thermoanaerobaculia bacterium]